MLRDKRVAIERQRMAYVLGAPVDPTADIVAYPVPSLGVTVHLERTYPFSPPLVTVGGQYAAKTFLQQQHAIQPFLRTYNITLPCVCCSPLRCAWSPMYGIREVLDEYVETSTRLNQYLGYSSILDALPFDDQVHSCVLAYL